MEKSKERQTKEKRAKSSVQLKILLPMVMIFIFFLVYAVIDYSLLDEANNSVTQMKEESLEAINISQKMERALLNVQSLFPEAAVTMDTERFNELDKADVEFKEQVERMKSLYPEKEAEYNDLLKLYSKMYDAGRSFMFTITSTATTEEVTESCRKFVEISKVMQAVIEQYVEEAQQQINISHAMVSNDVYILKWLVVIEIILIAVVTMLSLSYTRVAIVTRIKKVNKKIVKLSEKDLTTEKIIVKGSDEVSQLAQESNELQDTLTNIVAELTNSSSRLDDAAENMDEEINQISQALETVATSMYEITTNTEKQTQSINYAAEELEKLMSIATESDNVSKDLSASSKEINMMSTEGQKVIGDLEKASADTNIAIDQIFECITGISESAEKISNASDMIADIASQTNLLSLNASIEAARAGDTGRGFAVVAEEIRKLSEQSAQSLDVINQMIAGLQNNVKLANQQSDIVKTVMEEQSNGVTMTRNKFLAIANSLDSINLGILNLSDISVRMNDNCESVKSLMSELTEIAEGNSDATSQTCASSEEITATMDSIAIHSKNVKQQAQQLNNNIKDFKVNA